MPVATVVASVSPASVIVGQPAQATATTLDGAGNVLTGRTVAWSSSNTAVATVSAAGRVSTLAVGSVTVTATSEGRSGTATLVVTPVPVATVVASVSPASVIAGQSAQATATTLDGAGNVLTGRTVAWSSSNTAVATVNATGRVSTLAAGSVTVTATSEGRSGTATLVVLPVPVATVNVTLSPSTVAVGDTSIAAATTLDAGGNVLVGRTVAWSSRDSSVATVDANGVVYAQSLGSTTITATSEGRSGSSTVTVVPPPVNSVTVSLSSVRAHPGDTLQASATTLDRHGNVLTGRGVTWASTATSVATVNSSGLVTARGAGYASIRATSEGITGSGTLTVLLAGSSVRTVLVIGPHPDDEALIGAGRARTAVNAGDIVKMVVVTNGDQHGLSTGLTRQGESVAAARVLGLGEQDVIFLGYPDTILNNIYTAGSGTQVFTGPAGVSATYGTRGLGGVDYHRYLTGAAGSYDRNTMHADFEALIRNYQPDEIYTVTSYDDHPDHHAVALFVQDALASLRGSGAIPPTQLFQSIVWVPGGGDWPMVDTSGFTPTIPFQEPPTLSSRTPLRWVDTYRFPVPPEMLSTNPSTSMKYQCINQYRSQLFNWLTSFARADEFFWLTSY